MSSSYQLITPLPPPLLLSSLLFSSPLLLLSSPSPIIPSPIYSPCSLFIFSSPMVFFLSAYLPTSLLLSSPLPSLLSAHFFSPLPALDSPLLYPLSSTLSPLLIPLSFPLPSLNCSCFSSPLSYHLSPLLYPLLFSLIQRSDLDRKKQWEEMNDPKAHEIFLQFLENLLRTDYFDISLPIIFQCVTALLSNQYDSSTFPNDIHSDSSSAYGSGSGSDSSWLSVSPSATSGRFRLLSLGLRMIRKSLTLPNAPSGPRRRVLRERIIRCSLAYFEAKPVWVDPQASSAGREIERK